MATKDEILTKVRSALGRDGKSGAPKSSPGAILKPPPSNPDPSAKEELAQKFCEEIEKLGGRFAVVRSIKDVRDYISMLVDANSATVAAVSDSDVARRFSLADWIKRKGLSLVPNLSEFSRREGPNGDQPPMERYKWELIKAGIGVTAADYAIADTASLVLVTGAEQHRLISLMPPVHICLLDKAKLLPDLPSLLATVKRDHYSGTPPQAVTFITGTSRTADIELQLTRGVHGPREVHVLLYSSDELTDD